MAAFAYFTSQGSGSGSGSVGTGTSVSIDSIAFSGALYPGGSTSVSFVLKNGSSSSPVKVGKVVADPAGGTNGISGLPTGCSAADFHFADVSVNQEIAKGGQLAGSGTLSMDDTGVNQDACKGASPVLRLKVDNTGL